MATNEYSQVKADASSCISPSAGILGDVTIGPQTSIFAGAQIRGDEGQPVIIGARTNIQECAVVHVSPDADTKIGDGVTIGHGAIVHGCTIENDVLVGMGSIVLDGAIIHEGSLIGAGALVTGGKEFPPRSLIIGSPAKAVRELSEEDVETMIRENAREYVRLSEKMVSEGMLFHPGEDFTHQL